MRLAFICDTPYQTLNASNLYWTSFRGKEGIQADMYIVNQFNRAAEIYEKIREAELFDNVYFLKREENRFMPKGFKRYLRVAYSYLNPKHAIRNQMNEAVGELPINKYDAIFSSVMTCFVSSIIKLNPNADFMLFDDGTGSYTGDLVANGGGLPYKIFSLLTGSGANAARAKRLYVNNAEMCNSTAADEICQIPKMDQDFLDLAYDVYGVEKQQNKSNGIVFLSQPTDGKAEYEHKLDSLIKCLLPWKEKITVRMHPRDTNYQRYSEFKIDRKGEMWELKIAQMDLDNTVLIGEYSTAQMTPKILYDKEPWLIFTYHLDSQAPQDLLDKWDMMVEQIRDCYNRKERIALPRSTEELKTYLHQTGLLDVEFM